MRQIAIMITGIAVFLGGSAAAEESRSEIGLQGTGFFTTETTGQGTAQTSTNTGGLLVGYRYSFNRWLAAEAVYGYDRNTQQYVAPAGFARVEANIHQATGGLVFRMPTPARFRFSPYLLAEGGALVFDPRGNALASVSGPQRQATGVFAYGCGADFPLFRHVALRAEYRGLVYSAPNFGLSSLNTSAVTHTAEPSAGIVFRF
ncbi:MAG TPA: outer membrane beta-barrel protein [Terriglobales bacterium]|nr:outer membrane beta-barrel protein [Terriglobales bacterium]